MRALATLLALGAALSDVGLPPPLPRIEPFVFSEPNATLSLGPWRSKLALGSLEWPGLSTTTAASFFVLSPLISREEVRSMLAIVRDGGVEFDTDPDTVDGLATHEFYLEASGTASALASVRGKPDSDGSVFAARGRARAALAALTAPIVNDRVLPFVNERYADACGATGCVVCQSLVRRYLPGERQGHGTHFDIQALVTVVVSLSSFGSDFDGGLFVTTGAAAAGGETAFVGLQAGDAAVHQSSLLHGVRVDSGARWSWILWLKNAADPSQCPSVDATAWTAAAAAGGDAVAQFIHARRVRAPAERARWLRAAAEGGLARAANELGMAHLNGDGVPRNATAARTWLSSAAGAGEPDALFNLGLLAAGTGDEAEALRLFHAAAVAGSAAAAFNVGASFYSGRGGVPQDFDAAAAWFVRAGDGRSLHLAALIAAAGTPKTAPDANAAGRLLRAAARAGHAEAAMQLATDTLAAGGESKDAAAWLRLAVRGGSTAAAETLRNLESRAAAAAAAAVQQEVVPEEPEL